MEIMRRGLLGRIESHESEGLGWCGDGERSQAEDGRKCEKGMLYRSLADERRMAHGELTGGQVVNPLSAWFAGGADAAWRALRW